MSQACIIDVEGAKLTPEERRGLPKADPWGVILFSRSCESPGQIADLCAGVRDVLGRDCLVFIDQEGGRVQRLTPPIWPQWPSLDHLGRLHAVDPEAGLEAAWLHHRLIAHELKALGVNADCAPCLDLSVPGAHGVIGDRSFGADPAAIGALGRAALQGLHAGGVAGVVKHVPGHGRAKADSHKELPRVAASREVLAADLKAFGLLADAPMAMTAHVLFEALDPDRPATLSPRVIAEIVRGDIGFDGLLMTDCLAMGALSGSHESRARAALDAGCDVAMLCHQSMDARLAFADACGPLGEKAAARASRAEAFGRARAGAFDAEAGWARFGELGGFGKGEVWALGADPTAIAYGMSA
jgi:beta-N-acetylhexosaminidase